MKKKELYETALGKLQSMYETIFDNNGNLRPEFNLTDEEIEAFRTFKDEDTKQKKKAFETLFSGIIYNKYTLQYEGLVERLYELSEQIYSQSSSKNPSYNPNQIYACHANNWDGNFLFSGNGDPKYDFRWMKNAKIGLYNLNGTYSYEIDLAKDEKTSQVKGKLTIVRERVRKTSWSEPPVYEDHGVETHSLNEISSEEVADVIAITENELSQILNSLTDDSTKQGETRKSPRR